MAEIIYLLCACTSLLCAALLLRAHRERRTRLLLWSGWCFVALACNNALLFIDLVLVPDIDLSPFRTATALLGMGVLVFGLMWED